MNFGTAIKTCREARALSRHQLAKDCELSPSYITLLEQSKRDPSLSVINKISEALEIPPSILVFLATDKKSLEEIDEELAERLSAFTLKVIKNASDKPS